MIEWQGYRFENKTLLDSNLDLIIKYICDNIIS